MKSEEMEILLHDLKGSIRNVKMIIDDINHQLNEKFRADTETVDYMESYLEKISVKWSELKSSMKIE
jgi:hypothetical protein